MFEIKTRAATRSQSRTVPVMLHKGIEFLSQTVIFLFLYLCISMSGALDISNYELF